MVKISSEDWVFRPNQAIGFDSYQTSIIKKYDLQFSTGYIGMVRCYYKNKNIWQTSVLGGLVKSGYGYDIDYEGLSKQTRDFVNQLFLMEETDLENFLENTSIGLL